MITEKTKTELQTLYNIYESTLSEVLTGNPKGKIAGDELFNIYKLDNGEIGKNFILELDRRIVFYKGLKNVGDK